MTRRTIATPAGDLAVALDPGQVYRIGHRPNPWTWTPWQYASGTGLFSGRWDDPRGSFRTIYAGADLLACLLEVLGPFRPDPLLADDLAGIVEDAQDVAEYPSQRPGMVPLSWLEAREASSATLSGAYCVVTDKETLPTLRAMFLPAALRHGLADLDAGALRLSAPRALTQQVAGWLYDLHDGPHGVVDGVQFESRHGDRVAWWAVFERDNDDTLSRQLSDVRALSLHADQPDLREAFRLHRLTWAD